jgi:CheY-like chemotaxis protein
MTASQKKKILLAEDDDSMRRFLEVILKKAGYDVLSAEDGLAAMQIALETDVDTIIADAIMPHLTGYDLCRMMRGNPAKKHVPFVILSGLAQTNETDCLADVYLLKGENLKEELIETLSKFFDGKSGS